jgi:hypothetical protein
VLGVDAGLFDFTGPRTVTDKSEVSRLLALVDGVAARELPSSIRCDGQTIVLKPQGYGNYVTNMGMSADGLIAVLHAGHQYAPLLGGGGACVFRRSDQGWVLDGCIELWAS